MGTLLQQTRSTTHFWINDMLVWALHAELQLQIDVDSDPILLGKLIHNTQTGVYSQRAWWHTHHNYRSLVQSASRLGACTQHSILRRTL